MTISAAPPRLQPWRQLGYAKMGSFGRLSGRSILVVEDEPLIAIGLKALLEDEGAGVEIASNPCDALRLTDETHFSAAILDFGSAGSESAPLCRALKAYAIPFMFYTGYHDVHESSSGPPRDETCDQRKVDNNDCRAS
jgi:CheY-like chemotaxis protein